MEKQSTDTKLKWYFKTSVLVIALLSIGPLALPLLWFNPHLHRRNKIVITIIVLVLTYFLVVSFRGAWDIIMKGGYSGLSL